MYKHTNDNLYINVERERERDRCPLAHKLSA
jgi:hypothetical protein